MSPNRYAKNLLQSEDSSERLLESLQEKTDGHGKPSSCLIVKVIYVWLVMCGNEVAYV
jgi:hypothetical protein